MRLVFLFDFVCLLFFIVHLPVSVFLDSQVLFPSEWYPKWSIDVMKDYVESSKDPLMMKREPWFVSLVAGEIFLQVPFFVFAIWCYIRHRDEIRIPALLYSAHTVTTMIPILTTLIILSSNQKEGEGETTFDVNQLLLTYIPFLMIPFLLGIRWISAQQLDSPLTMTLKIKTG